MKKTFFIFSIFSVISFAPLCGMEMEDEKAIAITTPGASLALQQQRQRLTDALDGGLKVSKFMILTGPLSQLINDYSRKKEQASKLNDSLSQYKKEIAKLTFTQLAIASNTFVENMSMTEFTKVYMQVQRLQNMQEQTSEEEASQLVLSVIRPTLKILPKIVDQLKPLNKEEEDKREEFKKITGFDPELFGKHLEITPKIYISSLDDETVSDLCKGLNL